MARKKRPNNTGCLRRRPNGTWEMRVTAGIDEKTGRPLYRSFYARTQAEARRKGEAFLEELKQGRINGRDFTVAEWADRYLEHHGKVALLSPGTIDGYTYTERLIKRVLGHLQLKELTAYEVECFLVELRNQGYSSSTITKARGFLYGMCRAGVANKLLPHNVVADVENIRFGRKEPKECFRLDEIKTMMRDLKYDKIGLSIRLMLFTGLRKGEMLGLTKIHISEDGSIVTVTQAARRSKGKTYISDPKTPTSTRIIPVPKCAREYAILLRNCIEDGLIWSSDRRSGQPMNTKTFDQYYYEALDSINMRRLSPHRCRHSYVSMGKAAGIPLEILRRLAGHSNGTVTEDYMHIEQSVLAQEVDKIDALFAEEWVKA